MDNTITEVFKAIDLEEQLSKQLDEQRNILKEVASNINILEVEKLPYESIMQLMGYYGYRSDDVSNKIKEICTRKRNEKYPQFTKPHRFPELNELQGEFPNKVLMFIDDLLYNISVNEYIMYEDNFTRRLFKGLDISDSKLNVIFNFLHKKGVVKYSYTIKDERTGCREHLSEEKYNKYIENFSKDMSDREDGYCYLEIYRDDDEDDCRYEIYDNYDEIYTLEQLNDLKKLKSIRRCKSGLKNNEIMQ